VNETCHLLEADRSSATVGAQRCTNDRWCVLAGTAGTGWAIRREPHPKRPADVAVR